MSSTNSSQPPGSTENDPTDPQVGVPAPGLGRAVGRSRAPQTPRGPGIPTNNGGFGGLVERIVANRLLMLLMTAVTALAVLIYGTATLQLESHVVLSLLAIAIGLVVTQILPEYRLVSVVLSLAISLRYIIWRGLETLNLDHGFINACVSLLLYGAEIYTVFVLVGGYFQTTIFLDRRAIPLPADPEKLPSVDIFIPTYNESVEIVRRTAVAAMAMDYPKKKVYILDDGRRPFMKALADEVGCGYLIRPDNKHAKSGNINAAMLQTDGELVAFFDADHSPVKSFLALTVGFFLENDNLALAQTPHHFYNPDPFERNLHTTGKVPPEQNLFYDTVQVSNDYWNSTFFCGSCALIRRAALEDVGGMAVETVTEDAHTALKMQSRGWDTCYLNIPQAAGLATESFSGYVGQRIRWARGMAQILRIDPPFLKRGLAWYQRLNYTFAASHFFFGVPRLIFLLAPITYLIFGLNPLNEDVKVVLIYAVPHLILSYINTAAANGAHRHSFWPEVYETAMAPYAGVVTTLALIAPKLGTFNVTAKGEQTDRAWFNWRVTRMLLAVLALCLAGFPFFVWRVAHFPLQTSTLCVAAFWNLYNVSLLIAAIAAAIERPQRRVLHRIKSNLQLIAVERNAAVDYDSVDDGPDEKSAENSYASVDGVDPVEVYEDLRDEAQRRMETSEASLASELRQAPSVLPPDMPVAAGAWRAAGRTLDLTEEGVRFLLPPDHSVPRHMLVTFLANDGSRVTVHTEALGAYRQAEGVVVRGRFRNVTDAQVHALIRMMFSDPNTWTRDRYTKDKPLQAIVQVFTSPFRALFYALGVMPTPAEPLEPARDTIPVHRQVLQCYHCSGVLTRPEPKCPHCGEPLMLADDRTLEPSTSTFDRLSSLPAERRPGMFTYLLPALAVVAAVVLSFGWNGIFQTPSASMSRDEALGLSYHYSADDGADLADELVRAVAAKGNVEGDWGSRVARLRFEYPRPEDPRPPVHKGQVPDALAELFFKLHDLESRYRRGEAPPGLEAELRGAKESFKKLL